MKKIHYLIVLSAVALSACQKQPLLHSITQQPSIVAPTKDAITLSASDYTILPSSDPAQANHFFGSLGAALSSIPTILNAKYSTAVDKSTISVTFATGPAIPPAIQLVDSTFSHVAYTLTADDIKKITNYGDLSDAQLIQWLGVAGNPTNAVGTSFGAPVNNTLAVTTFTYYNGAVVPNYTASYLFTNNAWMKIYTVSAAQYTALNKAGDFAVADAPNIPNYINGLLKTDPAIAANATVGQVQYVSYKYYVSSKAIYQRILPVVYDGTNWVAAQTTANATFTKTNGQWVGTTDNSVHYTLAAGDYTTIDGLSGIASAAAVADLKAHNDFSIAAGVATGDGSRWTDVQIANGIISILKTLYTAPSTNQKFYVTFKTYGGYTTEVDAFNYDGTNFVYLPVADNSKYTLTGDDYTNIATTINTGATSAAQTNLNQYGDFSSAWTQAQINAGIAAVLKSRYTAATANQLVTVTYAVYNGGNVTTTGTFKYDGTNWNAQ